MIEMMKNIYGEVIIKKILYYIIQVKKYFHIKIILKNQCYFVHFIHLNGMELMIM